MILPIGVVDELLVTTPNMNWSPTAAGTVCEVSLHDTVPGDIVDPMAQVRLWLAADPVYFTRK